MNHWLPGSDKQKAYHKEYLKAWRARRKDPEKMAAYKAEMESNKFSPEENKLRARASWERWVERNPKLHRQRCAEQRLRDKAKIKKYASDYKKSNPEKLRIAAAMWRAKNPDAVKKIRRRNRIKHPDEWAKYRASILQAIPVWADEKKITEIYAARSFAQEAFEIEIHVDHMVPLNSPLVCGLHCEDNLQLLTATENIRKQNRYWPDMWSN